LKTFLIGLLDGAVDVGEVDAMLSLFKQPNSMPMTDINIHIQAIRTAFLVLGTEPESERTLYEKKPQFLARYL